jgi:thiosulfate/3-mercaptopyruvate sulfurtransferase
MPASPERAKAMRKILVSTDELARHLGDPDWIVIDTRHELTNPATGPRLYAEGHIPGAYFMHVDNDLSAPKTGKNGRHPLPDLAEFAAKVNRCGITPASQVVVYDEGAGGYAVRLWWMLSWLGHEKVALLDGGYGLWTKEGRPESQEAPAARKGAFVPRPHLGDVVDVHFVERFAEAPSIRLVDARAAERFTGRQETIDPVAGHIPGAVNRFWKDNLEADGRFKAPGRLRAEYDALLAGMEPAKVVHMCGSGVTACHSVFAMELAGLPGSRLYPGSWSEWCADPARPVAAEAGAKK